VIEVEVEVELEVEVVTEVVVAVAEVVPEGLSVEVMAAEVVIEVVVGLVIMPKLSHADNASLLSKDPSPRNPLPVDALEVELEVELEDTGIDVESGPGLGRDTEVSKMPIRLENIFGSSSATLPSSKSVFACRRKSASWRNSCTRLAALVAL
jgi:hypothetical protein